MISCYTQELFPSTSLDESSIEFEVETDFGLIFVWMCVIPASVQFFEGRLSDAFKKEKSEDDSDEESQIT